MGTADNSKQTQFRLEPWNRGISEEKILDDIRRVAKSLGLSTVKRKEYERAGRVSYWTACARFGSWNNALSRAGLQTQHFRNIPTEKLFENLEQIWITLGRQPRRQDLRKPLSLYSDGTYKKRFGTWRKALEEFVSYISSGANEIAFETNNAHTRKENHPPA